MVQLRYEKFMNNFVCLILSLLSFERTFTPSQTQTGFGPRFMRLLPQDAVLPGSKAGNDSLEPKLGFAI